MKAIAKVGLVLIGVYVVVFFVGILLHTNESIYKASIALGSLFQFGSLIYLAFICVKILLAKKRQNKA